ncbi:MAG: AAA family ATPase [Candidatus Babeliales bacterium]
MNIQGGGTLSMCKRLLGVVTVINFYISSTLSMPQQDAGSLLHAAENILKEANLLVQQANQIRTIGANSNAHALKAHDLTLEASKLLKDVVEPGIAKAQEAAARLGQDYDRLIGALKQEVAVQKKTLEDVFKKWLTPEDMIKVEHASVASGDYERKANINAQAAKAANIELYREKVKSSMELLGEPKFIMKIVGFIAVIVLCIYVIKYGIPALMNYITRPRVISETSSNGWLGWFTSRPSTTLNDLIFAPALHHHLQNLLVRVQTAQKYNETLPNVLLYGDPGTGKTAFVRALAQASGLEYALTSGSEFAKITDLSLANEELRKLLTWAKRSTKGLIIFIDEAESLFANRKLPTTPTKTQDLINTFLSLVQDQSQKKLMFILATNYPFKLDDAVADRIGESIKFTLPEASEREKILLMYLIKFAQENKEAIVNLPLELKQTLPKYAEALKGLSPRAIKFVAEEMIINARRQKFMQLTDDIARASIDKSKRKLQQTKRWEKERDAWVGVLAANQQ